MRKDHDQLYHIIYLYIKKYHFQSIYNSNHHISVYLKYLDSSLCNKTKLLGYVLYIFKSFNN